MFQMIPFLMSQTYRVGNAKPVKSGQWSVDNLYDGQPTLYLIVRKKSEIIASAEMSAHTVDGLKNIDFSYADCGHRTKLKVVEMLELWLKENRQDVYPA